MQSFGLLFLVLLIFIVCLSYIYIPQDSVEHYKGSATLTEISLSKENTYGFTFQSLDIYTGRSKTTQYPPFLFIHGHKGNVNQAIDMAQYFAFHDLDLDVYSIDFKEGAVALSHTLMYAEAEFVNECVKELSLMYESKITIIAHSMGGIVASLAMSLPDSPVDRISTMIALSTPFEAHPTNFNLAFPAAYSKIHEFWLDPKHENIFTLSVTGGIKDFLIPSRLTNIEELVEKNALHAYSTQIEGLHLEMDHNELVYGTRFLEKLNQAIKVILGTNSTDIKNNVNNIWQNKLSIMLHNSPQLRKFDQIFEITKTAETQMQRIRASSKHYYMINKEKSKGVYIIKSSAPLKIFIEMESIFELIVKELQLDNEYYYKIDNSPKFNIIYKANHDCFVTYQYFSHEPEEISFIGAMLSGSRWDVEGSTTVAMHFKPGPSYSQGRYPIHIQNKADEEFSVVYGKCGLEEIVKYNEKEVTFYFNEFCEEGPDIWIMGFNPEQEYEIEFRIDLIAMLIMLSRDFRLHIFSMAACIAILFTIKSPKK